MHDRGHVAQHLLDRRGQEGPVLPQALPLVGVLEEGRHGPGHQVPGGLVAGHDEEQEEEVDLDLVELLAVHLGVEEHGDHVGVGASGALADSSSA